MKRVLMIAFHFPPQAGSSGIQRTLSFSKNLGKCGWEPIVLSAHPRAYDAQSVSLLTSIAPSLIVRRVFALDAKRHLGIKGRYSALSALPDRWVSWWLGAVPAGLKLVRSHRPQVIWSTFPIATAHLIGLTLHRLTGLPWVADFRDPMLQPAYPNSAMQRRVYGWIERETIKRCRIAVFTTHSAMQSYRTRFPELPADKFVVIENGYDDDDFSNHAASGEHANTDANANARTTLVHSGVLYQNGRDPSRFLQAIAGLKHAGSLDARGLRVILRAPGDIGHMTALVATFGVEDIVEVAPPVPYREALNEMLEADGLLVFQGRQFNSQVPAKIYEYFRARKPILALVDPDGETAQVLQAAGFDALAAMDDPDAIGVTLGRFLAQVRAGQAHIASETLVANSSRIGRANELARVLERACSASEQR